jgi:hypothetical protein
MSLRTTDQDQRTTGLASRVTGDRHHGERWVRPHIPTTATSELSARGGPRTPIRLSIENGFTSPQSALTVKVAANQLGPRLACPETLKSRL